MASLPVNDLAQPESNARMPASRQDLFALLDRLGIETRTVEHEAVFTVEQSRELEKDLPGGHTKNL
ncbi:MAG: prolyl-tRNA synthetase associated domain-containing protein, partial [Hyphomicrobiaceae bacterium]|nr:prolyl-tRNA synthetase associated domain-containing protein [Hyphomicrobiaceae bacterium]